MTDNKRKCGATPDLSSSDAPIRSSGFKRRDQRLPASPPLSDPPGGVMAIVRSRYRHAFDKLFGTVPMVLNAPCNRFQRAADKRQQQQQQQQQLQQQQQQHRRHIHVGHNTNSKPAHIKASPEYDHTDDDENDATLSRASKRRRPNVSDQVVPNASRPAPRPASRTISAPSHAPPPAHTIPECDVKSCVCANSLWTSAGVGPDVMLRTAEELSDRIILLYNRFVDVATNQVDYTHLQHAPDFYQYLASARKLRYFDPLLLNPSERKAFFLNVYNSLMIHAITVMTKPRTMFERISMYNTAAYNIGGRPYTLNMVEHGVLRSNRTGNGPFAQPQFTESDARRLCSLPKVDARIHFALNCGSRSCPAVRFYEARSLDRTLDAATRIYLEDMVVDEDKRSVTLPKLMQWYKVDFSDGNGDTDDVLQWTLPFLAQPKRESVEKLLREKRLDGIPFKTVFGSYDWSVNDLATSR